MKQKSKRRSDAVPDFGHFTEVCDPEMGFPQWVRSYPCTRWTKYESIVGMVGSRGGENPVSHVSCRASSPPACYGASHEGTLVPIDGPTNTPIDIVPQYLIDRVPRLSSQQIADKLQNAVNRWTTEMPNYADLGVFIGELRKGVSEFLPQIEDQSSKISGKYLKYKFGVEPFVRDMKKFLTVHEKFRKQMKHLHATQGKTTQCTYQDDDCLPGPYLDTSEIMFVHIPIIPGDPSGFPPDSPCAQDVVDPLIVRTKVEFHKTDFRCHGFVTNELKSLDNTFDQLDAVGACLGLNNPFKVMWNLSPWTFVGDWFVDTDRVLDELSGDAFDGKLILEDGGGYSIKSYTVFSVEHINPKIGFEGYKGSYTVKCYDRFLGTGSATTDRLQRLLNGRQFNADITSGERPMIGAALLDNVFRKRSVKLEQLRILSKSARKVLFEKGIELGPF